MIDRAAIEAAVERRHGENAAQRGLAQRASAYAPLAVVLALAVTGVVRTFDACAPAREGPMSRVWQAWTADSRAATLFGASAAAAAIVNLIRLRRSARYRAWSHLLPNMASLVAGVAAAAVGAVAWAFSGTAGGYAHTTVPPVMAAASAASAEAAAFAATVAIFAPNRDGDFRLGTSGTGVVVLSRSDRAWVVTCRHVAIPSRGLGVTVDPATSHRLWLSFADGREVAGKVRWIAEPPIDVAVVEAEIAAPPAAVELAHTTTEVVPGAEVLFVPNPLRNGWRLHRGTVTRREPHNTPGGMNFDLVCTTLPVRPGDSGSGLFDARLRLVGLNTWRRESGPTSEGVSLPSEAMAAIRRAIEENRMELTSEPVEGSSTR